MRVATIALVIMVALAGLRGVASAADIRGVVQQAPAVNAAFVNAAYQVLFNRPAAPTDVTYWTNPAPASQGQAGVVQAMINSPDFRQIEVNALVQHFLGRPASTADLVLYSSGGSTMAQVAAAIMASPAYYAAAGGTVPGFLAKVYNDAVGSPINPQGIAYFNGLFTSTQGISSMSIATSVEQSSSGSAYLTAWLAQNVLHHSSMPNGATLISAALAAIAQML
jgi:hypothetical protein